jgi:hypothetical protein
MTEEEQYYSTLQEISEIYRFLTQEEPSPDDEIEAREKLIDKFGKLKDLNIIIRNDVLIGKILIKLENWDTLDLWFKEVEDLSANIKEVLKEVERNEELIQEQDVKETKQLTTETAKKIKPVKVNVNEIVAQVSEQFKGEINNLKDTIEKLKEDLEKKDASLKEIVKIKKAHRIIPKKNVRLPPPEIKIPVIIKPSKPPPPKPSSEDVSPQKPPQISTKQEIKTTTIETPDSNRKISKFVSFTSEETAGPKTNEDIAIEDLEELKNLSELPKLEPKPSKKLELESQLDKIPIIKLGPPPKATKEYNEEAQIDPVEPIESLEITSDTDEKPESALEPPDATELPSKPPKRPILTTLVEEVPISTPPIFGVSEGKSETSEKQKIKPILEGILENALEEHPKNHLEKSFLKGTSEQPKISAQTTEDVKITPLSKKKTIIKQVKVEESDAETIRTSTSDLFNVFSSAGEKTKMKTKNHMQTDKSKIKDEIRISEQPMDTFGSLLAHRKKIKEESDDFKREITSTPFRLTPKSEVEVTEPEVPSEIEGKPDMLDTTETSGIYEASDSIEELPTDKDSLYQELIALEGRRYSLERKYKDVDSRYQKGSIGDSEYKKQNMEIKNQLASITNKINRIRRIIATI